MMGRVCPILSLAVLCWMACSCGASRKVSALKRSAPEVNISLPGEKELREPVTLERPEQDTLVVYDFDGRKVMLMKAVMDENGDMVANEELKAAVVTARFRNVAERHGKVDLEFQVTVPRVMLEQDWQTRFYPDMFMLGDSTRLDMLILTGDQYRKTQLRGYQRYNNFIAGIVSDTTKFINLSLLERFLQRNIPQVYAYKYDQSFVSEEEFTSCFGVTERQAIEHYTDKFARYLNNRKKARMGVMYRRYVKAPIVTDRVRLDTVFVNQRGDFVYNYVQTVETRPNLRKIDIVLSGEIFRQDFLLYNVPRCKPLTFYISSISTFTDNTERYLTKIIERRAEANAACHIEFEKGRWDIRPDLGVNSLEIGRIKDNIREILLNEKFDLDSIMIRSYASPEGSVAMNDALSARRAAAAREYFSSYMSHVRDSLRREAGLSISVDDGLRESDTASAYLDQGVRFSSRAGGENWDLLDRLVRADTLISEAAREKYFSYEGLKNLDERENRMMKDESYAHIRDDLYPKLRSVRFDFYLHRKGMVKDTVHTTELDTTYMRGVQAIRDRDYGTACALLGSYQDFNSAVAYLANDRNLSAMRILELMERTAVVNYLLAILYSRLGDEQKAVQCYIHSCSQDRAYVSRGNLDPEISRLIKKYDLHKEDDDFTY